MGKHKRRGSVAKPRSRAPQTTQRALPDFDLAPVQSFDPKALDFLDPAASFILLLAAVFNDMKTMWYAIRRLNVARESAGTSLEPAGQVAGMTNHTLRLMVGTLRELTVLIREHQNVVDSSEFKSLVEGIPKQSREAWERVRRVACERDATSNARTSEELLLVKIRGALAFHYDSKAIQNAYTNFFARPNEPLHDRAMLSDGDTMEATRFYFADAAMEEGLRSQGGRSIDDVIRLVGTVGNDVNRALKFIVMAYLTRVATPTPYPRV